MEKQYTWAILSLIAAVLVYFIFQPTERNLVVSTSVPYHAHSTHYFFADPKCLGRMYPKLIANTKLIDGRVEGRGEEAVEVYDVAFDTHIRLLGFHNFTAVITANVHSRSSFHHINYIKNLMYINIHYKVRESGDDRMSSAIEQEVSVGMPLVFWTFVNDGHHSQLNDFLAEGVRNAETHLGKHQY